MKTIKSFILVALCVFAAPAFSEVGGKLLAKFLSDTKTMTANFHQTLRSKSGEVIKESSGKFYLQRPGKFRWDYALPYEQQIVSDGSKIWIYDVDLQQVTVQKQNAALNNTPMALIEGRLDLEQAFHVRELDNKNGIYRVELTNKSHDSDFNAIVVGVDKSGLRFMQLRDQFEQTTDIVFDSLHTNADLASGLFVFTPPKGVDVFGG